MDDDLLVELDDIIGCDEVYEPERVPRGTQDLCVPHGTQNQLAVADVQEAERIPAPPEISREEEERDYVRAGYSEDDRQTIDEELRRNAEMRGGDGYWDIEDVRATVLGNTTKATFKSQGGYNCGIDGEQVMIIDPRIKMRIFVDDDNIYTREELIDNFPFNELKTTPEEVFIQQELGVFPPKKWAMKKDNYEYLLRDVGSTEGFQSVEDMVAAATRRNYAPRQEPIHIFKTKFYFAGEKWERFHLLRKFIKTAGEFAPALEGSFNMLQLERGSASRAQAIRDAAGAREDLEAARRAEEHAAEQARLAEERARLAEERARLAEERRRIEEAERLRAQEEWRRAESERLEKRLYEEQTEFAARAQEAAEERARFRRGRAQRQAQNAENAWRHMVPEDLHRCTPDCYDPCPVLEELIAESEARNAARAAEEARNAARAPQFSVNDILDDVEAILSGADPRTAAREAVPISELDSIPIF